MIEISEILFDLYRGSKSAKQYRDREQKHQEARRDNQEDGGQEGAGRENISSGNGEAEKVDKRKRSRKFSFAGYSLILIRILYLVRCSLEYLGS